MGTKGDVLLVMVAASLAARAVASSRSIKISANIAVPPLVRGPHWAQCFRADVMAITKCRSVENASPPLRSAVWHRSCESYPDRASIRFGDLLEILHPNPEDITRNLGGQRREIGL
jgi:hypothetical protein